MRDADAAEDSVTARPREESNCDLAQQLLDSYEREGKNLQPRQPGREMPSPREVAAVLTLVRELLLPGSTGEHQPSARVQHSFIEGQLATLRVKLMQQLFRGLHHRCVQRGADCAACEEAAAAIGGQFMNQLPALRRTAIADVRAAFDGDPAATGVDEVVFSYPGVRAVTIYRIAHALWQLGAAVVPRMMTEQAHADTGIDIHPGARIGASFFIDHGTGVVIGETTVIGDRVRVYQGVTLGALSLPSGAARTARGDKAAAAGHSEAGAAKRHPTIEDDVIIYANATILGGDTVIGAGSVIGGNVWLTHSVPPGSVVTHGATVERPRVAEEPLLEYNI